MKALRAEFLDFLEAGKISFLPYAVINGKNVEIITLISFMWYYVQYVCKYLI